MGYAAETWSLLQHELASQYSNTTLSTWFDEIQAVDFTDNRLVLCCANAFKRSMIESHFHDGMKAALGNLFSSSDFDVEILSSCIFRSNGAPVPEERRAHSETNGVAVPK